MSSNIGMFREEEIKGKPFNIFHFSQTHIPTSSSGEATISSSGVLSMIEPLFFCPSTRHKVEMLKRKEIDGYSSIDMEVLPFSTPPHFPNKTSFLDSDNDSSICKLPISPLFWCNKKYRKVDFSNNCDACKRPGGTDYYLCVTCDKMFHKECVEAPLRIKHPSYPFLSLQLYTPPSLSKGNGWNCFSCSNWLHKMAYHSPTYNLSMHPFCAMKPINILIDHPKRHPHSLTFFPKQNSLLCNICGVVKVLIPTYVCARCVFVFHQDCIYFPYVIRISRHLHRISFTYSLPTRELSCQVCSRKLDNDCGAYSCNKCDGYFVHSRCALRRDLWDGKELEGVPEEPEIVVDPFKWIDDGTILHFSHDHNLKLEISRVYDEDKLCQGCVLPVYQGGYYSCVDQYCDFILHEDCASSPLKIYYPLYPRPLTLKVVTNEYNDGDGHFKCNGCERLSCGFVYESPAEDWSTFKIDLRCALISEPFKFQGHQHPLFLALTPEEEESAVCRICGDTGLTVFCRRKLNCIECDYIICFGCATLPYKARYKHDKHVLTFREGREASDESGWCDICERKMVYSREVGFYSCDDNCCTTLHVQCLLGKDPYLKAGQTIDIIQNKVQVLRNDTMSRPFCYGSKCAKKKSRCLHRVYFEKKNRTFCSFDCAY